MWKAYFDTSGYCALNFWNYKEGKVRFDTFLEAIQDNARELFEIMLVPSLGKNIVPYH